MKTVSIRIPEHHHKLISRLAKKAGRTNQAQLSKIIDFYQVARPTDCFLPKISSQESTPNQAEQ